MSKEYSKKAKGRHSAGGLGFFHWYIEDWFHVLLRLRTVVSVSAFTVVWTAFLLIFAGVYVMVDRINPDEACGLGEPGFPIKFYGAFAFSLETTTTVGYGLPNGV
jgi:potassium inwardly-rectifying channel subfamily J protein 9